MLLDMVGLSDAKFIISPLCIEFKLSAYEGDLFDNSTLYRNIVGSLQYAILKRPDLAFAVKKVFQFMAVPWIPHWTTKRILRCLLGSIDYGLNSIIPQNCW